MTIWELPIYFPILPIYFPMLPIYVRIGGSKPEGGGSKPEGGGRANMSDSGRRYEIKDTLQEMAAVEENLRNAIRAVITRAALTWGNDSLEYAEFRAFSVSRVHGVELRALADRVVRKAQEYLGELSERGLTEAMIDAVRDGDLQLEQAMNAVFSSEEERAEAAQQRVEHLNEIYRMMQRLSVAGKNAFAKNPAAYHNFILWGKVRRTKNDEEQG